MRAYIGLTAAGAILLCHQGIWAQTLLASLQGSDTGLLVTCTSRCLLGLGISFHEVTICLHSWLSVSRLQDATTASFAHHGRLHGLLNFAGRQHVA